MDIHPGWEKRFNSLPPVARQPEPEFGWHGWEDETDLGNEDDREGVQYLTITQGDAEVAIIVHRQMYDDRDDRIRARKVAMADRIVDALNAQKGGTA